jgi:hypothetical protein
MLTRQLSSLTAEERFTLAQFHAWRWANCTKAELSNRKAAAKIAAGIANLSMHRTFGALTVSEYRVHGDELWNRRGQYPWRSPWEITGGLELEPTP